MASLPDTPVVQPGPDADRAFSLGVYAATALAVGLAALLYATGTVNGFHVGVAFVTGLPVYLVVVAIALSAWLGFDPDVTDLQPVSPDGERTERR
ncbi:hypothetical protein [Halobacterium yunchengense]|uniref:hypothetical protein n=1 Tax=Halobacterium yunchengense TaxID=3108497 RepID=UPI0030082A4C